MPGPDESLWNADEIAHLRQRYNDAITARDAATVTAATANATAAPIAKAEVDEAQRIVDNAKKRLDEALRGSDVIDRTSSIIQYVIFAILAFVVLGSLVYGLFWASLLPVLANIATSRGLITFLIAVITVTIALILALATVVSDSPDRAQRFLQGKEILTALIGVLGTIVGFYFGHTTNAPLSELNVAPVIASQEDSISGKKLKFTTFVSAGKAPYTYRVAFKPDILPPVMDTKSPNGWINVEEFAPAGKEIEDVSFVLTINDSEGRKTVYDSAARGEQLHLDQPK